MIKKFVVFCLISLCAIGIASIAIIPQEAQPGPFTVAEAQPGPFLNL